MVDRLEELLARLEDEDDEEQEDALELRLEKGLPAAAAPEGAEEDGGPPEGREAPVTGGAGALSPAGREPLPEEEMAEAERRKADAPELAAQAVRAVVPAEEPGAGERTETAWGQERSGDRARRGLEELYRQTARAVRPAEQILPVEQAGRTLRAEEPGRTAALTVDELDRAVRRDSRRYDGEMMIF